MIRNGYVKKSLRILLIVIMVSNSSFAFCQNEKVRSAFKHEKPLDSLLVSLYNEKIIGSYEDFINDFILLDSAYIKGEEGLDRDTIYQKRLELVASVIKLPYNNIVREYIDTYTRPNAIMSHILGRALYYLPYFERELDAQGLPIELRVLPIIESALNPAAVSPGGAGGLWQFMYPTAKLYGMKVNSFVDERFDPIISTRAACKYLKKLYGIYGDWTLVLAAYNCGPGNVNKAMARVPDAKNYWDIYNYLPSATRGFVPAFIGATYAYTFHKAHNLEVFMPQHPIVTDTVMISGKMLHFNQISSTIDVPIEVLRGLNPMYKMDIVPALSSTMHLILPMDNVLKFIEKEEEIYSKADTYLKDYTGKENIDSAKKGEGAITYKVKNGDILGTIAKKHKVSVANLIKWNNIKNAKALKVGQKLTIYL